MVRLSGSIVVVAAIVLLWAEGGYGQVGRRHRCIVMAGTLVCPQCPMIAGLLCPKNPPYGTPPWTPCVPQSPTPAPESVDNNTIAVDGPTGVKERTNTRFFRPHVHQRARRSEEEDTTLKLEEATPTPTTTKETTSELLAQLNNSPANRNTATSNGEEVMFCERSDDCPCPMICCRQGEGCPRRCVRGLRLPPPF